MRTPTSSCFRRHRRPRLSVWVINFLRRKYTHGNWRDFAFLSYSGHTCFSHAFIHCQCKCNDKFRASKFIAVMIIISLARNEENLQSPKINCRSIDDLPGTILVEHILLAFSMPFSMSGWKAKDEREDTENVYVYDLASNAILKVWSVAKT